VTPKEQSTHPEDAPPQEKPEDLTPVRVFLLGDDEEPTLALIEKRLWHVRQLYALLFLLRIPEIKGADAISVAALLLSTDPDSDLEELVPLRLRIQSAGTGTFWVDLFVQAQGVIQHLPSAADMKSAAEWLKSARDALTTLAALLAYLKFRKLPTGKESSDVAKRAKDAYADTEKRTAT
jgi:hypothetical protein